MLAARLIKYVGSNFVPSRDVAMPDRELMYKNDTAVRTVDE